MCKEEKSGLTHHSFKMSDIYYLAAGGETKGPYSKAQLKSMWDQGLITSETQYWTEGMDDWYLACTLLENEEEGSRRGPMEVQAGDASPQTPVTPEGVPKLNELGAIQYNTALTKCTQCGREVSLKAKSCSGCGAPLRRSGGPRTLASKLNTGCGVVGGIFFVAMIIVWIAIPGDPYESGYNLGLRRGQSYAAESDGGSYETALGVYEQLDHVSEFPEKKAVGYRAGFIHGYKSSWAVDIGK
jgi:hypothetical protein